MFSLLFASTNWWTHISVNGDLRRHDVHVTLLQYTWSQSNSCHFGGFGWATLQCVMSDNAEVQLINLTNRYFPYYYAHTSYNFVTQKLIYQRLSNRQYQLNRTNLRNYLFAHSTITLKILIFAGAHTYSTDTPALTIPLGTIVVLINSLRKFIGIMWLLSRNGQAIYVIDSEQLSLPTWNRN